MFVQEWFNPTPIFMLSFIIYESPVSGYRFVLKSEREDYLVRSLPFPDLVTCATRVEEFRDNLDSANCFETWRTHRGDSFFNFHGADGAVLATSDIYPSIEALFDVMARIRDQARAAPCIQRISKKSAKLVAA
jgi:uncharacterized protein YegP (UPF0339 family)